MVGNTSTDLSVEIIMPDNYTVFMQMSKPQITYVGGNFVNSQNLYDTSIIMTSKQNTSQVLKNFFLKNEFFIFQKTF
jgi:hypothetical protein